jgi:hypothetical protein
MPKPTLKTPEEMRELLEDLIEMLDEIAYGEINRKTSQHVRSQLNRMIEYLLPMVAHASVLLRQDELAKGVFDDQPVSVKSQILRNIWNDATDILADAYQTCDLCETLFAWEDRA